MLRFLLWSMSHGLAPAADGALDPDTDAAGLDLELEADGTCLDEARLLENLQVWRPDPRVAADVRVRVRADGDRGNVNLELWQQEELAVQRTFTPLPGSCADLHALVSYALALALESPELLRAVAADGKP